MKGHSRRKQDITDVLRGELSVVRDPHGATGLRFEDGIPGQMEGDLAVEGGFDLDHCQQHFRKLPGA